MSLTAKGQTDPREHLNSLGIPFTEVAFLDYVKRGDSEIVDLMLAAGIRPVASDADGQTAITIATAAGHVGIVRKLLEHGAPLEDIVKTANLKPKRKDIWEKLSSVSSVATVISGLIIAGVGAWFTHSYNRADEHLKEIEIVEKMIPHLAAKDSREAALVAISVLTDKTLSTRLAELYKGDGSIRFLQELVASSNSTTAEKAEALTAIGRVLEAYRPAIVKVSSGDQWASGFVAASSDKGSIIVTASYVQPPFTVETSDGQVHPAKSVGGEGGDLRYLSIDVPHLTVLSPTNRPPNVGMRVIGVGFIAGAELKVQLGTIRSVSNTSLAASYDGAGQVLRGFGGSPILDADGNVLGIAYSFDSAKNHIVARYTQVPPPP